MSKRGPTRPLLICLALQLGRSCSRAELIKCGWKDEPVDKPHSLKHALDTLRKILEPEGAAPGSVLREQGEKVSLNPERVKTDVADFLAAYEEAGGADSAAEQVRRLTKAVELYRRETLSGYHELLPDFDQPWIKAQRLRLAEMYRKALRRLKAALVETGSLKGAKEAALQLFKSFPPEDKAFDPQREQAWQDYLALPDQVTPDDAPAPTGLTRKENTQDAPLTVRPPGPGRTFLTANLWRILVSLLGVLLLGLAALSAMSVFRERRLQQSEKASIQRISERDRLYREGRACWNERTEEGIRRSQADFVRVITLDPDYAPGYAGLADADSLLGYYGWTTPRQAFESAVVKAREATSRARTGPERAEAHTSLAWAEMLSWNWDLSDSDFQEAFSAEYWHPTARQWHSLFLMVQGHKDRSLAEINLAVGRDPTPIIRTSAAQRFHYKGDYADAVRVCIDSLKEHPRDRLTLFWLGLAYEQEGNLTEALIAFRDADKLPGGRDMNMRAGLAHALAASGDVPASHRILTEMERLRRGGPSYVSPVDLAVVYTGLYDHDRNTTASKQAVEDKEQALALLEQGYREHAGQLFLLGIEPRFASLRGEPRFARLLQKMRLPPSPGGPPPPK